MGKLMTHLWFLASLLQNLHHGCNHTLHLVLPKSFMVLQPHCTLNSPKSPCSVSRSRSATKDGARRTSHHRQPWAFFLALLIFEDLAQWDPCDRTHDFGDVGYQIISNHPILMGGKVKPYHAIPIPVTNMPCFSHSVNHLVYGGAQFWPISPKRSIIFHPTINSTPGILLRAFSGPRSAY